MTQILPKCRQKAQRHRKGNRKTPGSAHPLQSSYELADAGGGNQIGAAGNAGEHQNEVGYRSKDCSQRTGQQRQQPVLYRQDSQICRQQPCQHGSFPLYQKENQIGYYNTELENRRAPSEHHHIGQQPDQNLGSRIKKRRANILPHWASPALTKCLRMSFIPSKEPRTEPTKMLSTMTPNTGQVSRPSMVAI